MGELGSDISVSQFTSVPAATREMLQTMIDQEKVRTESIIQNHDIYLPELKEDKIKLSRDLNRLTEEGTATVQEMRDINDRVTRMFETERSQKPTINPFKYSNGTWNTPFIIAASALAALSIGGTSFAKVGATEATLSLTAALQGLNEGNEKRYTREMEAYKLKMEEVEKDYERNIKRVTAIYNDKRKDIDTKLIEIRQIAQEIGLHERGKIMAVKDYHNFVNRLVQGALITHSRTVQSSKNATAEENRKLREEWKNDKKDGEGVRSFEEWKAFKKKKGQVDATPKTLSQQVADQVMSGNKTAGQTNRTGAGW